MIACRKERIGRSGALFPKTFRGSRRSISGAIINKADGSIVAWGDNTNGQTNVPAPNTGFITVAAGWRHNLAIRRETPLGDFNGDYAVDLTDYAFLVDALLGPFANPQLPNWFLFNFDGDFDLADLAEFQNSFGL